MSTDVDFAHAKPQVTADQLPANDQWRMKLPSGGMDLPWDGDFFLRDAAALDGTAQVSGISKPGLWACENAEAKMAE